MVNGELNLARHLCIDMLILFRIAAFLQRIGIPILPKAIYLLNRIAFSIVLPPTVEVGKRVTFACQGLGAAVHARAALGDDVYGGPQVIIGGRSGEGTAPIIGSRDFLGAGCRIMGPIRIPDGVTVAAGAVAISDGIAGQTVAGVPAMDIKSSRKGSHTGRSPTWTFHTGTVHCSSRTMQTKSFV
jgi:serine O-acetyltransferase